MKTKHPKKKPSQVVSVRISADVHRVISFMAAKEERSFGSMIRRLIGIGITYKMNEPSPSAVRSSIDSELWHYTHPKESWKLANK